MPKIATHTLGCKLNFAETSAIVQQFVAAGWQAVPFHEAADLYVINTCTVTAVAEKKCRNAIRQAVAQNAGAVVAVVGCFAQNGAEQIAKIPGVSLILGNNDKHRLLDILRDAGTAAPPSTASQPAIASPRRQPPSTSPIPWATAHAPSSRYRTDATISAPTAPSPVRADAAAAPPWPTPWPQRAR